MHNSRSTTFPPISAVTKPYLTTEELAHYTNLKPQTWRAKRCKGETTLKPIRMFGKLYWSTDAVRAMLVVS